jgi:hypothetical protein
MKFAVRVNVQRYSFLLWKLGVKPVYRLPFLHWFDEIQPYLTNKRDDVPLVSTRRILDQPLNRQDRKDRLGVKRHLNWPERLIKVVGLLLVKTILNKA